MTKSQIPMINEWQMLKAHCSATESLCIDLSILPFGHWDLGFGHFLRLSYHARPMIDPQTALTQRFQAAVGAAFGSELASTDPLIRPAQNTKFGDYQANLAMALAKRLDKPPRDVAAAILAKLDVADLCEIPANTAQMIAGPGFINLKLRSDYLARLAADLASDDRLGVDRDAAPQTVVVDYSGPNVAKEMHVGHLRSTVIGDAIARTLEFLGHRVIRQNHLGDWGTQFGMLIESLVEQHTQLADAQIGDLNTFYQAAKKRFDSDPEFAERARKRVVMLQSGDEQTLSFWRLLVEQSKKHFDEAYARLDITLTDDDFKPESFYNDRLPAIVEELMAKNIVRESNGAICIFADGYDDPEIIRKSDGGFGYGTTDLAGIRYRALELGAARIPYVVDSRQRDHFIKVLFATKKAGWLDKCEAEHVQFGTILGEDGKPFKTRSGDTVKLIDLLDEAESRAAEIVKTKNPELSDEERKNIAHVVGIGAVKYGDLSTDRVKDYVFSWNRMLAMEGNTAPYLQYAYARIRSIFRKGAEAHGHQSVGSGVIVVEHDAERRLVLKLVQFSDVVRSVGLRLEPHHLCNYLFDLATTFSGFYENCPVLKADNDAQRASRLAMCDVTARVLKCGLNLLGIEVLERM